MFSPKIKCSSLKSSNPIQHRMCEFILMLIKPSREDEGKTVLCLQTILGGESSIGLNNIDYRTQTSTAKTTKTQLFMVTIKELDTS